jgi:phosphoadenosine phosphosulfate reductase
MATTFTAESIESLEPNEILGDLLAAHPEKTACLTCSFQAEDMVTLHLLRERIPSLPVLFLDTGYHFAQTYEYRDLIAKEWSLNLVNVVPQSTVEQQESEFGILYRSAPSKCCQLRKVEPLFQALEPYELWFTGLRREQSPTRKNLKKLEEHRLPSGKTLLKVSLLADWTWTRVWEYTAKNRIKYLPQYDQGYLSIGCEPCTAIPEDPANPRSGRWGGTKLECGIHTASERSRP